MDAVTLGGLMRKYPVTLLPTGNYRTCPVRLSFPALFEPKSFNDGEPKYSAVLLFPKGANLQALYDAVKKKATEEFGPKAAGMSLHTPFRDQSEKSLAGYEPGSVFITASTKQRPGVVGVNGRPLEEDQVYAGCWVLATVRPFGFNAKAKKGISLGLQNIVKIADDEPFAGGARAEDEFADVTAEQSGDNAFGIPDLG